MDTLIIPRAINAEHYNASLGGALRSPTIWDTDEVLQQDPTAYEKMRHDAVIAHLVTQRKHEVAGTEWFLEPASSSEADKKIAQILETLLKKIGNFDTARFNLAEAILRGSSWAGIRGDFMQFSAYEGCPTQRWWVCTELSDMDKRRFRQVPITRPGDMTTDPVYGWEIKRPYTFQWEPLEPGWYVHHTYGDEESALGFGKGLSNAISQYWWAKQEVLKLALKYLDRWALGILSAKITLDEGSRRDPVNSTRVNNWLSTLKKMREGYVLVYDQKDIVEHLEANGVGFDCIKTMLDYFDGVFRILLLGASDPTNPDTSGGSYARATVQAAKSKSLIKFDRVLLESTITRDLVAFLLRVNCSLFYRLGLVPTGIPQFKIRDDEEDDPAQRLLVIQGALQIGLKLKEDEVYRQLKLTPPGANDRVIGGTPDLQSALASLVAAGRPAAPGASGIQQTPGAPQAPSIYPQRSAVGQGLQSAYMPQLSAAAPGASQQGQQPIVVVNQIHPSPAPSVTNNFTMPRTKLPPINVDARTSVSVPERKNEINVEAAKAPTINASFNATLLPRPKREAVVKVEERDAVGAFRTATITERDA